MPLRAPRERAFTLVEVVTTVAIMGIIAAAAVPTIAGKLKTSEAASLVSELENIRTGIQSYKSDVGRYPDSLYYLTSLPGTPLDGCGALQTNTLSTAQSNSFRGPYFNRVLTNTQVGYELFTGDTIHNAWGPDTLTPGTSGAQARNAIEIEVTGVDTSIAAMVDQAIDGSIGGSGGLVTYAQTNGPYDMLKFYIPIHSTSC